MVLRSRFSVNHRCWQGICDPASRSCPTIYCALPASPRCSSKHRSFLVLSCYLYFSKWHLFSQILAWIIDLRKPTSWNDTVPLFAWFLQAFYRFYPQQPNQKNHSAQGKKGMLVWWLTKRNCLNDDNINDSESRRVAVPTVEVILEKLGR
jgi:hypothetical protein